MLQACREVVVVGRLWVRVVWAVVMVAGMLAAPAGASVAGPASAAVVPSGPAGPSLSGTLPLPTLSAGPATHPWWSPSAGNAPSDVRPPAQAPGPAVGGGGANPPSPATSPTGIGSTSAWGTAVEVPGTTALNTDGHAFVTSVSCPSAGNCAAGGLYTDGARQQQAFVADEVNGTWGNAIEVPGTAAPALNTGGWADVNSVSCGSAGNCAAGGLYTDSAGHYQAFVADEVNGTWGTAIEIAAALNTVGNAVLTSVSCPSPGNCAAGGLYTDSAGNQQVFVADEVNGTWGTAIEVPGTAALNTGGRAQVTSVSCGSAGNCAVGGYYDDDSTSTGQAFVADEVNGTWGTAIEVPGTAALNTGWHAGVTSVSCGSAGNCAAGGSYTDSAGHYQAFVADEVNGTWGTAIEVPGTAALNTGGRAQVTSVSCGSAGNCAAGGSYSNDIAAANVVQVPGARSGGQVFVADEVNGTWGTAIEVPGTAPPALNTGGNAQVTSVSCASAGNCTVAGSYTDSAGHQQALVADEVNGTWGTAIEVPGTAALNTWGATVTSVSCGSAGNCAVGGYYHDSSYSDQAFVDSEH